MIDYYYYYNYYYRSRIVEKQRVEKTKIKYVIISLDKQKHNKGREFSVFSYFSNYFLILFFI